MPRLKISSPTVADFTEYKVCARDDVIDKDILTVPDRRIGHVDVVGASKCLGVRRRGGGKGGFWGQERL